MRNSDANPHGIAKCYTYCYCDSNGYAYTDSYANCDSNSYAYADSYANCDSNDPAASNPDAEAASDAAASSIGATRKRLCGNSRENLASSPRGEGGLMICSGRRACHAEA